MEKIKDIKDIVIVPDNSLEILTIISLIIFILIIYAFYKYLTKIKIERPLTKKEKACLNLKNINFNNTKDTIYRFEEYIILFLNKKNEDIYKQILKLNKNYKYKLNVELLEKDHIEKIKSMLKDIKC
jgi:hypothetical protein